MNSQIEQKILCWLFANAEYRDIVYPHLRGDYFSRTSCKIVFDAISRFVGKYNKFPNMEALKIELEKDKRTEDNEDVWKVVKEIENYKQEMFPELQFAIDETEKYCQLRAVYNAIYKSIDIFEGKNKQKTIHEIPELLKEAITVSFDNHIGHDYFEDAEKRYEFYHQGEKKIPFGLRWFDQITLGGISPKTLNVFIAPTGTGKTMTMCHFAAHYIREGYNVLYITLEMAEERIAERIDANLFNMPISQIKELPKNMYLKRHKEIMNKCAGKLIIKEYPTSTAGVHHFKALMKELQLKKNFKPDIVFVDYLNLCISSRYKRGEGTYTIIKAIAEELRGMAIENNLVLITATQTNRGGYNASDFDLTNTSESIGLPATADFMVGIIETDDLREQGKIMFKQLKNRYAPMIEVYGTINIDKSRCLLYDDTDDVVVPNNDVKFDDIAKQDNVDDPFADFRVE